VGRDTTFSFVSIICVSTPQITKCLNCDVFLGPRGQLAHSSASTKHMFLYVKTNHDDGDGLKKLCFLYIKTNRDDGDGLKNICFLYIKTNHDDGDGLKNTCFLYIKTNHDDGDSIS
jgi:hypothetical protein